MFDNPQPLPSNLNQSFGDGLNKKQNQSVSFNNNNSFNSKQVHHMQEQLINLQRELKDVQFELTQKNETLGMKIDTIR